MRRASSFVAWTRYGRKLTESAREMMSENVRAGRGPDGRAFVVTDEQGHVVLNFPFRDAIRD